ncbi:MAG: hypothetical protein JRE24_08835 [Deltaproteobacteria bacterium]|nr:hypothetical protein [Deltaproteobacteria bacterium]
MAAHKIMITTTTTINITMITIMAITTTIIMTTIIAMGTTITIAMRTATPRKRLTRNKDDCGIEAFHMQG